MGEDNRHGMTIKLPVLSDVWIRTSCCPGQMRIGKYSCHFVLGSKVFSSPYLQCLRHLYLAVSFQVHIQEVVYHSSVPSLLNAASSLLAGGG